MSLLNIFKRGEVGKHPLYELFMTWSMHGISDDALNSSLRPEFVPHVKQAKKNLKNKYTDEELLAELERVLSQLKG